MNDILFEILKAVVVIAVIVLTRYAVPYLKALIDVEKNKCILDWVETAVKAAQQSIIDSGEVKKADVTQFLKEIADDKNIIISDEQISRLIDAAVYAMKKDESQGEDE